MKSPFFKAVLLALPLASSVFADNITAIYGSGNPAAGWTVDFDALNNVQLGLRAKDRTTGAALNVGGVYTYATAPATRGLWNYEFSINSDAQGTTGLKLGAYDFYLSVDRDSSAGVSFATVNPLTYWADNSFGNNSTGAGLGVEGSFATLGSLNNIGQNSENITFGDYPGGALALEANATYTYELYAVKKGDGQTGARLADVSIDVVVGSGGAKVPDAGSSALLLSLGVAGTLVFGGRKSKV
jgi:hypothetical protein